jgi:hypothetical protein
MSCLGRVVRLLLVFPLQVVPSLSSVARVEPQLY